MRRAAALAVALTALVPASAAAQSPCDRFADGVVAGLVAADGLTEISGVAASRRHDGVLWAHDDSGGPPELSAVGGDGADLGTYAVTGAEARDWEDLAAHDGQLYIGDIGDNRGTWPTVTVYRAPEPAAAPDGRGGTLAAEAIVLTYPGGPVDAEALLVDPRTGDLVVLTKEDGVSRALVAPAAALRPGSPVTMTEAGRFEVPEPASDAFGLPGTHVTGADVSPDGGTVLVRTYRSVLAFARPEGAPLAAAFAQAPCEVPQVEEVQGEAVAFVAGGDAYVTVSEGPHPALHRFDPRPVAAPDVPAPSPEGDDPSWAAGYALVAAVLVLAAVVLWRLRRRNVRSRRR